MSFTFLRNSSQHHASLQDWQQTYRSRLDDVIPTIFTTIFRSKANGIFARFLTHIQHLTQYHHRPVKLTDNNHYHSLDHPFSTVLSTRRTKYRQRLRPSFQVPLLQKSFFPQSWWPLLIIEARSPTVLYIIAVKYQY